MEPAKSETHFTYCLLLDQYFLKKKSETSSEDNSARVVCLDGSLSAPRSRTWRTCFYIHLVISQPEPNIWAWGKKIIKLEVHAEVRLGMNLFLFCLPLAVPSTFRPKLPPERGQRSGFKDVWAAFASKVSHHGLGPWHSLLAAGPLRCLVQVKQKAGFPGFSREETAVARPGENADKMRTRVRVFFDEFLV